MERSFYFPRQLVDDSDLNNTETTKTNQIIYRFQGLLGNSGGYGKGYSFYTGSTPNGGILGSPGDYATPTVNLYVSEIDSSHIDVAAGSAIDINGNLIKNLNSIQMSLSTVALYWSWLSVINAMAYVKIRYQEVSGSLRSDITSSNSYYTRYTGSSFITVDGVLPQVTDILLATFQCNSSGLITGSIQDRRTYVRPIVPADAVIIDPTVNPLPAQTTIEKHITYVGSGTPTVSNPHGLTSDDLSGFGTASHIRLSHRNGIVLNSISTAAQNSWLATVQASPSANPYLSFAVPNMATASIGGKIFTSLISNLYVTPTVSTDGNYYVVVNASGIPSFITSETIAYQRDGIYLPLAYVTIANTQTTMVINNDMRLFNTIADYDIQYDTGEMTIPPTSSVQPYWDFSFNLARIRYQLGMAIMGAGAGWTITPPLTGGITSIANTFHTHTSLYLPMVSPGTYSILTLNPQSGYTAVDIDFIGNTSKLRWSVTNSRFEMYQNYGNPTPIYANLAIGSTFTMFTGTTGITFTQAQFNTLTAGSTSDATNLHSHHHDQLVDITSTTATVANLITVTAGSASDATGRHYHKLFSTLTFYTDGITPTSGTVYQNNSTTNPMFVSFYATGPIAGQTNLLLSIGPTSGSLGLAVSGYSNADIANGLNGPSVIVSGIVPPTYYYSVTGSNSNLSYVGLRGYTAV